MKQAVFALTEKKYTDTYLDRLLVALNKDRDGLKYKKLTYPRVNLLLQKLGKSKKNWDRDIFIGSVLDRPNPAKYFWWVVKTDKEKV